MGFSLYCQSGPITHVPTKEMDKALTQDLISGPTHLPYKTDFNTQTTKYSRPGDHPGSSTRRLVIPPVRRGTRRPGRNSSWGVPSCSLEDNHAREGQKEQEGLGTKKTETPSEIARGQLAPEARVEMCL